MQEENKQPGLAWSSSKSAVPAAPEPVSEPALAPQAAPGQTHSKWGFPSSKHIDRTQAPIYAGLLVGGIIAGVLLATAWSPDRGEAPSVATSTAQVASTSAGAPVVAKTTPTDQPLTVGDQSAGPSVTISRLNIARPTWVVVYVSREGKPGNALGARLFFAGDKLGKIGLLRNTEPGQSYFVGLSVDNGDRAFSLSKDKPLADADGGPLWATFRAL
jgi:hypothetical protein